MKCIESVLMYKLQLNEAYRYFKTGKYHIKTNMSGWSNQRYKEQWKLRVERPFSSEQFQSPILIKDPEQANHTQTKQLQLFQAYTY